jgi:hypothetical protein
MNIRNLLLSAVALGVGGVIALPAFAGFEGSEPALGLGQTPAVAASMRVATDSSADATTGESKGESKGEKGSSDKGSGDKGSGDKGSGDTGKGHKGAPGHSSHGGRG